MPDYAQSNTKQDAYIIAAKACLSTMSSFPVTNQASGHELEVGLPSWVPDWSREDTGSTTLPFGNHDFCAGGNHFEPPNFFENNRTMMVWGFGIDQIQALGKLIDDSDLTDTLFSWSRLLNRNDNSDLTPQQLESFGRTIHFDWWLKDKLPDRERDLESFKNFWLSRFHALAKDSYGRPVEYRDRRFFVLKNGGMGLAPPIAETGDTVYIPLGTRTPFLLRRSSKNTGRYTLVGECFVLDLMHGEVIEKHEKGLVEKSEILLE